MLVSTLSIIYNVGKDENEESETLISAIRDAKTDAGRPVWTPLTALTLMVFFVLAIQCMSTVAIVRRETNSWMWTLFMVGVYDRDRLPGGIYNLPGRQGC